MSRVIHYCYQMYLRTFEICLEIYEHDPARFLTTPGKAALKKTKVKLDLLIDINMFLMVEKGIRGGICHVIDRYGKTNNKCMKNFDKNKESSYLEYWDLNNLYGWVISQKFPVNDFKWVDDIFELNEDFIKSYNDTSDKGYFLEVDVQYPENLHNLHNDLPFLPESTEIEKFEKLLANLHEKTENSIHIRNLKEALNH